VEEDKSMKRIFALTAVAALALMALAMPAHAQATRTWVSGVGDDANPCSRTAPCKTFAGAISKTAPNGEINVLDPGGFGAVTITKGITISSESSEAGVLVSGTPGIIVAAGPNDVVNLRGLDFQGLNTGTDAIRFNSGKALHVEKCTIRQFTGNGILFQPGANANLFVLDTIIAEIGTAGIAVKPSGGVTVAAISRAYIDANGAGIVLASSGGAQNFVDVDNSRVSRNGGDGITVGATSTLMLDHSQVSFNGGGGVNANAGGATARLGNSVLIGNVNGVAASGGGTVLSFKNNEIAGSFTSDGIPINPVPGTGGPLQ
jgi:hypothetical protein